MTSKKLKFYSTRTKKDHLGRTRHEVYVPSAREGAWLPLDETVLGTKVMNFLLDESNTEPWKVMYLKELYKEFRFSENKRKRKEASSDDSYQEPSEDMVLETASAITSESPEDIAIKREFHEYVARVVLNMKDPKVKSYVFLHWYKGVSLMDIARQECGPDADLATVKRRGDTIRKKVSRLKDKIRKKYPA